MEYQSLLEHFRCSSVKSRMTQIDVMFLRSVLGGRVDCPSAVSMFSLSVPPRRTRNARLFHVPFGRVDSVRNGFLIRIPKTYNELVHKVNEVDILAGGCSRKAVAKYADSLGRYNC